MEQSQPPIEAFLKRRPAARAFEPGRTAGPTAENFALEMRGSPAYSKAWDRERNIARRILGSQGG